MWLSQLMYLTRVLLPFSSDALSAVIARSPSCPPPFVPGASGGCPALIADASTQPRPHGIMLMHQCGLLSLACLPTGLFHA